MDRIDTKLLHLLQREGPKPAAELGEIVGLSPSACHRRIRALEAAGIITGYAARLDPEARSYSFGAVAAKIDARAIIERAMPAV